MYIEANCSSHMSFVCTLNCVSSKVNSMIPYSSELNQVTQCTNLVILFLAYAHSPTLHKLEEVLLTLIASLPTIPTSNYYCCLDND